MMKSLLGGVAFGVGLAALSSTPTLASAPIVVTSTAQLLSALKHAVGGSTIELAPGTYSGVVISGIKNTQAITITSLQPSHPAVLVGLGVANSTGLNFSNLEMTAVGSKDSYFAFRVAGSSNLNFTGLDVHGALNATPGTQLSGFYFNQSSNITISDSHLHNLNNAISAGNETNFNISGNKFDLLNKGGIQMSSSSNVAIANNTFTDFKLTRGTHPDAIQFFTANTTKASHDISITGNLYTRGNGDPIQGIFIRDEAGNLPFKNLTVSDNAILGGMWNSIYIENAGSNLKVTGNVLATWPGLDIADASTSSQAQTIPFKAYLFIKGGTGALITGNNSQVYLDSSGHLMATPPGNTLLGTITDNGNQLLKNWSDGNQGTTPPPPPRPNGTASKGVLKNLLTTDALSNVSFPTGNIPAPVAAPTNDETTPKVMNTPLSLRIAAPQTVTAAVPEPSAWAMMLVGFFGVGYFVRRSSHRHTSASAPRRIPIPRP